MNKQKSVAIIGGGASGLLSSILCALNSKNLKVFVFDPMKWFCLNTFNVFDPMSVRCYG